MNAFPNIASTNEIFNLGYAVINFATEEITWAAGQFDAKRRNYIQHLFEQGHLDFNTVTY